MVRCLHQSAANGKNEIGKSRQTGASEPDREIKKCLKCTARDAKGKNALAGWRNRHTHLTQNQALARACGFDSRPGHHLKVYDKALRLDTRLRCSALML